MSFGYKEPLVLAPRTELIIGKKVDSIFTARLGGWSEISDHECRE
jgi:hypothetical protein